MRGGTLPDAPIEHIRRHLVALRMPRALETLDHLVQQIERGQIGTIEAIEMLLGDAELRQRLGKAARQSIIERFNWRNNAEQVLGVYERVISERRG